jgi:hypothetical protein
MKNPATALAAASFLLATTITGAFAAEEHVGLYAERGDPLRWRVPADTPRLRYEAEAKGIHASLAESLKECRALAAGRSACDAQAQSQHRADLEAARALLAPARPSSLTKGDPR